MSYQFNTQTYVKALDNKHFIICNYIPEFTTDADTLKDAFSEYLEHLKDCGIDVSKTAAKKKQPYYGLGRVQIGYNFTGKTYYADRSANECGSFYIDIYTSILDITFPDFERG